MSKEINKTDLVLGEYSSIASGDEYDSEDSNAENNWGNYYSDYEPSSSDEEDIFRAVENRSLVYNTSEYKIYEQDPDLCNEPSSSDEEGMIRAVENYLDDDLLSDNDVDLSSDTDDDKMWEEDPDLCNEDVVRYGEAYARYKARVLRELSEHIGNVYCIDDGYDSGERFYYSEEEFSSSDTD